MRKLKSMLFTAGIAAVLAVGVGASVATTGGDIIKADALANRTPYKSAIFTKASFSDNVQSYTGSFKSTTDDFVVDIVNANNNNSNWNFIKMGSKNIALEKCTITTPAIDREIVDVSITIDSVSAQLGKVNFAKLYAGASVDALEEVGSYALKEGEQTVHIDTPATNQFYQIWVSCQKGTSNGMIALSRVDFFEKETIRNFELDATEINAYTTGTFTLTANPNSVYTEATQWSFTKKSGTADLTITNNGPVATIKAIKAGDAIIEVKATDGDEVLTKDVNIHVAEAIDIATAKTKAAGDEVWVKGIVTDFRSSKYIYVADANGVGLNLNGTDLVNKYKQTISVGDNIVAHGTINKENRINIKTTEILKDEAATSKVTPIITTIDKLTFETQGNRVTIKNLKSLPKKNGHGAVDYYFEDANKKQLSIHVYDNLVKDFEKKLVNNANALITINGIASYYSGKAQIENTDELTFTEQKLSAAGLAVVDKIINTLTCDATGVTAPSVDIWNEIKADYDKLSNDDKVIFVSANAANKECGAAVAKYDYIVTKYGKDVYADFMLRDPATGTAVTPMAINNSIMITCIVVISALAITGISVLVIVKRRKATR